MSRQAATTHYNNALKLGQKYYRSCLAKGKYPYPQVLKEVFSDHLAAGQVNVGLVDIPAEQIIGTATVGRRNAFAGNFMPLLHEGTEFSEKWINLCEAHLSECGITDPITCFEYMGRFYVVEGNKRVSVLKSYDAPTIPGNVTRILPNWSDEDQEVQVYYEFLSFYQLSAMYDVMLTTLGGYAKLQAWLGFAPDHVWTKEEKIDFRYGFRRFKDAFQKLNTQQLEVSAGDALLIWLQMNPAANLQNTDLEKSLAAVWPDIRIFANGSAIELSTEPPSEERLSIPHMLGLGRVTHLNVAFIYALDEHHSLWTLGHEAGRRHLEKTMGEKVTATAYVCNDRPPLDVMEEAVEDGAQMIFATTPPMIAACRQLAQKYPHVKVLNCSLSMPYFGVRTYYSRIFEAKFITGAVAGAMAREGRIGYVANYPIIGTIAAVNAFALGARLTNPNARIELRWTCLPGNPLKTLVEEGVRVISNRDSTEAGPWEWGTYRVEEDESLQPLSSPVWNWGRFYEGVVQSVFDGTWSAVGKATEKAVNYWWGMSSGVIDVSLSPTLPDGVKQLAHILKQGILNGDIDPFSGRMVDQQGCVRNESANRLSAEEIIHMDWLLNNVEGSIPAFDELLPVSQQLVRLLGLHKEEIQPDLEEGLL